MLNAEFYKVADMKEACALLSQYGEKARILAGGTDLMVAVNRKLLSPEVLIYIGSSGLDYIKAEGDNLVIGAATTYTEIARSALVSERAPLLAEAVKSIGSPAIRNMGTIGGNLVNASPAADAAVALLALGARLKLVSANRERNVDVEAFFTGPGETVLQSNELVQEVIIPSQTAGSKWAWHKLGKRKTNILSVISVAIVLQMDSGISSQIRIALGSVAPTPLLAKRAGALLEGKQLDGALIEEAAKAASQETTPIDDVRATAWYRRRACEALVKRFLSQISG